MESRQKLPQGNNFADAAKQVGVRHFVYSSVANADKNTGIPHFDSKYEIEKYIQSIQLPYTIIRPVSFMENWEYSRADIENGVIYGPLSAERSINILPLRILAVLLPRHLITLMNGLGNL